MAGWGLLLLVAAWPWRCIVIDGSLQGWMSLGTDVGRWVSDHMWRMVISECGEKMAGIRLVRVGTGMQEVNARPEKKLGWSYV
jgi:hypothetical protein